MSESGEHAPVETERVEAAPVEATPSESAPSETEPAEYVISTDAPGPEAATGSTGEPITADPVLLAARDQARAALAEITEPQTIGSDDGHEVHEAHVLTLYFECRLPGYPGWRWAATLARVDEASEATVLEMELLPGAGAVVAPEWVPWSQRLAQYREAQSRQAADEASAAEAAAAELADEDDVDPEDDLMENDFSDFDDEIDGVDIDEDEDLDVADQADDADEVDGIERADADSGASADDPEAGDSEEE